MTTCPTRPRGVHRVSDVPAIPYAGPEVPTAAVRTRVVVPLRFPDGYETTADGVTFDGLVDGKEHLLLGLGQTHIGGDGDIVAELRDRLGMAGLAVDVDDEARIAAKQRRAIEGAGQTASDLAGADVPGDMPP